ncbi:hypothetical protein D3C85_1440900 [compost metagenome]
MGNQPQLARPAVGGKAAQAAGAGKGRQGAVVGNELEALPVAGDGAGGAFQGHGDGQRAAVAVYGAALQQIVPRVVVGIGQGQAIVQPADVVGAGAQRVGQLRAPPQALATAFRGSDVRGVDAVGHGESPGVAWRAPECQTGNPYRLRNE